MGLVVDNFAGGGGASTGIEAALGRAIDIAINHDEEAIVMHEANHPGTRHIRNNIWQIDPRDVCGREPVDLAWFSPDCKHFSKAKGGRPVQRNIRDLAWVVVLWAQRVKPAVIMLENVEEFRTWGPVLDNGQPCPERKGTEFQKWLRALKRAGYKVEWRELRACDYGAPTSRKRLFLIARSDDKPIVWPAPTHGPADHPDVAAGRLLPYRTAAEIIDWSIPCPSIFERARPLKPATMRRVARGVVKFVLENPRPFIAPLTHQGDDHVHDSLEPARSVTGAHRGETAVAAPYLTRVDQASGADRNGVRSVENPAATIATAGGIAVASPFLAPVKTWGGGGNDAQPAETPTRTTTTSKRGEHAVVAPILERQFGKSEGAAADKPAPVIMPGGGGKTAIAAATLIQTGYGERKGQAPRVLDLHKPLGAVVAGGGKHAAVTAFLDQHNFEGRSYPADGPLPAATSRSTQNKVAAVYIEQANTDMVGRAAAEPLSTIVQKGCTQRIVASHLMKYRGTSRHGQATDQPLDAISCGGSRGGVHFAEVRTLLEKYGGLEPGGDGPVLVVIDGETYAIVDIGLRMLTPRELFNAQGFPPDYIIDPLVTKTDARGRTTTAPMTKTSAIAKCGNAVCPPMSYALVRANLLEEEPERLAA